VGGIEIPQAPTNGYNYRFTTRFAGSDARIPSVAGRCRTYWRGWSLRPWKV